MVFFVRHDKAIRPFLVVERFAILGVGEQDHVVRHRRVDFRQGENNAITVFGLDKEVIGQPGAFKLLVQFDAGFFQEDRQHDAFVNRGLS